MIRATNKRALSPEEVDFLNKAFEVVELKLREERFGVEELAHSLNLSRSYLHRKLNSLTGLSPSIFIRQIRLNHAKKLLVKSDKTSSEISYLVGFGSPAYFTKCFHDHFGYPPGVAKNKIHERKKSKLYSVESLIERLTFTPKENRSPEVFGEIYIPIWKRQTSIYFMVIVVICIGIFFFLTVRKYIEQKQFQQLEKSIAVLPFRNDSEEKGTVYFANGVTEEIINNLAKISELKIPGRTSVEQFRDKAESIPEIGEKLNVSFILEGSVQKYGDQIKISVQLLRAKEDKHVWSDSFEYRYEDQFEIMKEIAQKVAEGVSINISPQEQQIINKIPTYNITAYDIYLQAEEIYDRYLSTKKQDDLNSAIILLREALALDSTFARAYTGLAFAYIITHRHKYLDNNYLDSAYLLANKALIFDDQLDEAYFIRGLYYEINQGDYNNSIAEYNNTIKINPNYYRAYRRKALINMNIHQDMVKTLENYHNTVNLNKGAELPHNLRDLSYAYKSVGFLDKAELLAIEALKLDKDTSEYYIFMAGIEDIKGNYQKKLKWALQSYQYDSLSEKGAWALADAYFDINDWDQAFYYYDLCGQIVSKNIKLGPNYFIPEILHKIGYVFYQYGKKYESELYFYYLNTDIIKSIQLNRYLPFKYYDMAGSYAFFGKKEEAYRYLDEFAKRKFFPIRIVNFIKRDPLFDSLREEEEFKAIVKNVEAKYLKEHERVKVWLEQNEMP
jgi:TolB-like protein/AraC-like DNA-binding protein